MTKGVKTLAVDPGPRASGPGPSRPATEPLAESVVPSPIGDLVLQANRHGLIFVGFVADHGYHTARPRPSPPVPVTEMDAAAEVLRLAEQELKEYFAATRRNFTAPLELTGTEFQISVWRALVEIPYGDTTTYRELAAMVGRPNAVRAAGAANGANPISIIVPCHRVVGSGGSLTGYGGGIEAKRFLIELEAAHPRPHHPASRSEARRPPRPSG